MGECKIPVPTKLDLSTVARLDADVKMFAPFCEGRGTLARVLIELAYAAIDKGILRLDLAALQEVLSNSSVPVLPRVPSIPSVPEREQKAGKR